MGMNAPACRLLIEDIALKEGYVTVISGEPGTGKTSLCLKVAVEAAKRGDEVVYYTFNESSACANNRLKKVFGFEGTIHIKEGLSLAKEGVATLLDDIMDEASKGKTIIVDSIDALMLSISLGHEYRAILQTLYRSVRNSNGRLILVSENPDPYSIVGYAADAYIALNREIFMEHQYRYAYIKKARDVKIEYPFVPFSLINGFTEISPAEQGEIYDFEKVLKPGGRYILEFDSSTPYHLMNFQRRAAAALFLQRGHGVAYFASPEETKEDIIKNVREMVDDPSVMKNFIIVTRKERFDEKMDWKRFFMHRSKIMNDLKKVTGKPPISLFTMWFNNLIYQELKDLYPELILDVIRKDQQDGTIAIGYTVEGLPVNKIERLISNEYLLVKKKHGKIFIIQTKETPRIAAFLLHEMDKRLAFSVIPVY